MVISLDDARMCPLCAHKQNILKMQKFGKGQRASAQADGESRFSVSSAAFFSHDKDDA